MNNENTGSSMKVLGFISLSATLLLMGIIYIAQQFNLDMGYVSSVADMSFVVILTIISLITGLYVAYRGATSEGLILIFCSAAMLVQYVGGNIDLYILIMTVIILLFCIIALPKEDMVEMSVFTVLFILGMIISVITTNDWIGFITDNSIIGGIIYVIIAALGLYIALKELKAIQEAMSEY